jgi:hypothetical protein
LIDGKTRLYQEAKELREIIAKDVDELLEGKKLAIRLNNLVSKYEQKLLDDQKSQNLKLADEITLKDLIKDKLHREYQGLRSSADEYRELDQVNPSDIQNIADEIKKRLGN